MAHRMLPARRRLLHSVTSALLMGALIGASSASAQTPKPYWQLSSSPAPANLTPGAKGKIIVTASNLGDAVTSGAITVTDKLPPGLKAIQITGALANQTGEFLECNLGTLSCTDPDKPRQPYTGLKVAIQVEVEKTLTPGTSLENEVLATGGGAAPESVKQPVKIGGVTAFGVEKYEFKPEEEGGAADTRAGSHPFQLTTTLAMNQSASEEPAALPKNLQFNLPPGLLGNPTVIPQCSQTDFTTVTQNSVGTPDNLCGPATAVGVAEVTIDEPNVFTTGPETRTVPIFNLEPAPGEPARFGIMPLKVPVVLDTAVRTGSDYGIVVTARNTDQAAGLISSKVTFWGVPGKPIHNASRGWECAEVGSTSVGCTKQLTEEAAKQKAAQEKGEEPKPFLSLPTSCSTPWEAPMRAQSWVPGAQYVPSGKGLESEFPVSLGECDKLTSFSPAISVEPETSAGSTPSGLTVKVTVPQPETDEGLAEATVKETTVTLPEGVLLNPGAANGLQACSALQMGFEGSPESTQTNNNQFSANESLCEEQAKGSKVGTVSIVSPDLEEPLTGPSSWPARAPTRSNRRSCCTWSRSARNPASA